ncbi:MAG: hypothetical protein P8020_21435, partial [Acidobacteriota bacterium]
PDSTELIIGDIGATLPPFIQRLTADSPVGFVALDVDTYSSSVDALKIFSRSGPEVLLPATCMYVDDSYINIMQSEFCGEGLAISEFNEASKKRKIAQKIVRTHRVSLPWHHAIYFTHVFDHPVRDSYRGVSFIGLDVNKL